MRIAVAYGSDGEFGFRADNGEVIWADPGYAYVTCVDVGEWLEYYGEQTLPDMVDVLDLSYWHTGGYEPAEVDFRIYLSEARSDNNE